MQYKDILYMYENLMISDECRRMYPGTEGKSESTGYLTYLGTAHTTSFCKSKRFEITHSPHRDRSICKKVDSGIEDFSSMERVPATLNTPFAVWGSFT